MSEEGGEAGTGGVAAGVRVSCRGPSGRKGRTFANIRACGRRVRNQPPILTGCPHRYSPVSSSGRIRAARSRKFGPGNSREQSYARGTAQWRGLRGAGSSPGVPVASPGRGKRGTARACPVSGSGSGPTGTPTPRVRCDVAMIQGGTMGSDSIRASPSDFGE
ncbi:hypothetical protein STPH2_2824 [Streptomyces sp. KO7888]|nr:hypothetical protein [Streptomyces sp. KO7888]